MGTSEKGQAEKNEWEAQKRQRIQERPHALGAFGLSNMWS